MSFLNIPEYFESKYADNESEAYDFEELFEDDFESLAQDDFEDDFEPLAQDDFEPLIHMPLVY